MGQLWSLVSILNSGTSRRENLYSPFGHKVNFRHVTSRKLRVKKRRSVKAFYSSPLIVVGTIRNNAVPFELVALSSLLSLTSTAHFRFLVTYASTIAFYDVTSRPLTRSIETHSNNFVDQLHRTRVYQQDYGVHRFFCHRVQRNEVLLLQTPSSGVWDAAPLVLALLNLI